MYTYNLDQSHPKLEVKPHMQYNYAWLSVARSICVVHAPGARAKAGAPHSDLPP